MKLLAGHGLGKQLKLGDFMKIINAIVGYIMFWFFPRSLVRKSLHGYLLQLNVRLPKEVTDQIANSIYLKYLNNVKLNKILRKESKQKDMHIMWNMIEHEAFFLKDLLSESFCIVHKEGHENTISILNKYNIKMPNLR